MKQCHNLTEMRQCHACPFIREGNKVNTETFEWKINKPVSCEDRNIMYLIECRKEKCRLQYIGETERTLRESCEEHKTYVNQKKMNKSTGKHVNLPGHSVSDMTVTILEKVKVNDTFYRGKKRKVLNKKI